MALAPCLLAWSTPQGGRVVALGIADNGQAGSKVFRCSVTREYWRGKWRTLRVAYPLSMWVYEVEGIAWLEASEYQTYKHTKRRVPDTEFNS